MDGFGLRKIYQTNYLIISFHFISFNNAIHVEPHSIH